ncbi:MAG TPA: hypothetical protein VI980_09770 [Acidimicrobiia bacterium]|nr:hypothetical protein [Acidimicrobiia bacterium]
MKKFVFLYQGLWEPNNKEMMEGWVNWMAEIGNSIVDSGNPFGPGREVTNSGSRDLPLGPESTTGYTIVEVDTIDDAEKLLANCPIITSVHIYEAMSM